LLDAQTLQSRIIKVGETSGVIIEKLPVTEEVPTLSIAALKQELELYALVDVRSADERTRYSIGGTHTPLDQLGEESSFRHSSQPLVFYCASGKRSAEAVKRVRKLYPNLEVYSLEGGIKAWKEQVG
ncbi:MAG: rhodanese-like domain-containing protein, partial [Hymenobacteraceae bacterium]|nr:rhodanese-like domain-containing protein [Hymenobacteraceae bacterium]